MAILTLAEVRSLLQVPVGDTSRDTLIGTLIPLVQAGIVDHCRNAFLAPGWKVEGDTISFTPGTPAYIDDSDSGFVDAGFPSGCDINVHGSGCNDGIYGVTTVAAGRLTLNAGEQVATELANEVITITRVVWPKNLKVDAAQLINYYLTKQGKLVNSESLPGGYSVDYKKDAEVWSAMNKYRKPFR